MNSAEKKITAEKVNGFFQKNRKGLLTSLIAVVVIVCGVIVAFSILDFVHTKELVTLETYNERFSNLQNDFLDPSKIEEVDSLLTGITSFAGKSSGYAGASAWCMVAAIKKERKEWKEAEDAWLKAAKTGQKTHIAPVAFFNAAVACEEQDNKDSAIEYYAKSLTFSDFPAAAHAQFAIGRIKESQNDKIAALEAYQAVIDKWRGDANWTKLANTRIIALGL